VSGKCIYDVCSQFVLKTDCNYSGYGCNWNQGKCRTIYNQTVAVNNNDDFDKVTFNSTVLINSGSYVLKVGKYIGLVLCLVKLFI
jgi:hypothetical protein